MFFAVSAPPTVVAVEADREDLVGGNAEAF